MAKVLLAEDDLDLSSVVRRFLMFEHHRVECVTTGDEALNRLRVSDFDLLILDWNLPGKSGVEIIAEFRRLGRTNPILMITAGQRPGTKLKGSIPGRTIT